MKPAIELRDVWFTYGDRPVLEAIDMSVARGAFLGIIGPNGAGKTTLLKLVLGLLEPSAGEVRVFGSDPRRAHGRIGYVPQYARFDRHFPLVVRELVLMGRLARKRTPGRFGTEDREAVDRALARLELAKLADTPIDELSGGELQRALVARALALEPRILLLDEPTASVDTRVGRSVYHLLEELTSTMTVVLVSHDVGVISRHVDSVACLNRRLFFHGEDELTPEMVREAYGAPVDLVAHEGSRRVLEEHGEP